MELEEVDDPRKDYLDQLSDEQAAAIGRLSVAFNVLDELLGGSIAVMLRADKDACRVLTDRMQFDTKLQYMRRLLKHYESTAGLPESTDHHSPVHESFRELADEMKDLLNHAHKVADVRNNLMHCRIVGRAEEKRLETLRGGEAESNPETLYQMAEDAMTTAMELSMNAELLVDAYLAI